VKTARFFRQPVVTHNIEKYRRWLAIRSCQTSVFVTTARKAFFFETSAGALQTFPITAAAVSPYIAHEAKQYEFYLSKVFFRAENNFLGLLAH